MSSQRCTSAETNCIDFRVEQSESSVEVRVQGFHFDDHDVLLLVELGALLLQEIQIETFGLQFHIGDLQLFGEIIPGRRRRRRQSDAHRSMPHGVLTFLLRGSSDRRSLAVGDR